MYEKYKYNELTLTATNYNNKISVELPCDAELSEVFGAFKTLLSGLGYYEDALEHIILEEAERYEIRAKRQTDTEEQLRNTIMELRSQEYIRISNDLAKEV